MTVKLLTEHDLEFLTLKGDCKGSPESTLVKIPHCWISCIMAQICVLLTTAEHRANIWPVKYIFKPPWLLLLSALCCG